MSAFIVRSLPSSITAQVRAARRAPRYGHPVYEERASGTGPCRECLRPFSVGVDDRLLFTYSPFNGESTLAQPGPVFIHATPCERHVDGGYPDGLRAIPVVAQAYQSDGTVHAPVALQCGAEEIVLARVLDAPAVAFVVLRHAEAGCFIARVERGELTPELN